MIWLSHHGFCVEFQDFSPTVEVQIIIPANVESVTEED